MINPDHTKFGARRLEIAAEMERLKKESEDLDIAERVFKQLYGIPEKNQIVELPKAGRPRPEGTPTTFEMTDFILLSAEKEGKDGLTISEIVDEIRKRYWPGLASHQITPSIYGFVADERLHKTAGGTFKRKKNHEKGPES